MNPQKETTQRTWVLPTIYVRGVSNGSRQWTQLLNSTPLTEIATAVCSISISPSVSWVQRDTVDGRNPVWNPINNGINYLSTGAGFQPSTVVNDDQRLMAYISDFNKDWEQLQVMAQHELQVSVKTVMSASWHIPAIKIHVEKLSEKSPIPWAGFFSLKLLWDCQLMELLQ